MPKRTQILCSTKNCAISSADAVGDRGGNNFAITEKKMLNRTIITIPHHALVGVEGKPGPGESFVQIGNRYYVLCEVAGPAKLPPGSHSISGSFEYVAVDPVGS